MIVRRSYQPGRRFRACKLSRASTRLLKSRINCIGAREMARKKKKGKFEEKKTDKHDLANYQETPREFSNNCFFSLNIIIKVSTAPFNFVPPRNFSKQLIVPYRKINQHMAVSSPPQSHHMLSHGAQKRKSKKNISWRTKSFPERKKIIDKTKKKCVSILPRKTVHQIFVHPQNEFFRFLNILINFQTKYFLRNDYFIYLLQFFI